MPAASRHPQLLGEESLQHLASLVRSGLHSQHTKQNKTVARVFAQTLLAVGAEVLVAFPAGCREAPHPPARVIIRLYPPPCRGLGRSGRSTRASEVPCEGLEPVQSQEFLVFLDKGNAKPCTQSNWPN